MNLKKKLAGNSKKKKKKLSAQCHNFNAIYNNNDKMTLCNRKIM